LWGKSAAEVRHFIERTFVERDVWQGKYKKNATENTE